MGQSEADRKAREALEKMFRTGKAVTFQVTGMTTTLEELVAQVAKEEAQRQGRQRPIVPRPDPK